MPSAGDYSSDAIVTAKRFTVVCQVTRNPDSLIPIDSSSVVITALAGDDSYEVTGSPSGQANQYSAIVDVTDFSNGPLTLRCSAADTSEEPQVNSDEIATFLDLGPRIDVFSPVASASYANQVDISFVVTEQPVAEDDTGANIASVSVTVGAVALPVTDTGGGSYFATLDFDAAAFDPPLDGPVQIEVSASNDRTTTSVTRTVGVSFLADSDGPTILITAPEPGQLVSGFMNIEANVSDPAGIDSVIATVAHNYSLELFPAGGSLYTNAFDTRQLSKSWVFPLVEVAAIDTVGNESSVGRVVALDNRPPLVALDSPPMREGICVAPGECLADDPHMCSRLFDPLGSDAVDDGETVGALMELRARAEDVGNGALAPSNVFIPVAAVDQDAVQLFVLDDTSIPLLVDTNSDSVCDALNPNLVLTSVPQLSNEAAVIDLASIAPAGESDFKAPTTAYGTTPSVGDDVCVEPEGDAVTEGTLPQLCATTPLTRAIVDEDGITPALYSIAPIGGQQCGGNAFDAPANNIADGWTCAVAMAPDNLGNVGISPPLRFCVDHDGDATDGNGTALADLGCAALGGLAAEGNRPSCTDGCTLPLSFADLEYRQLRQIGVTVPECSDGADNDGDELIDFPDDLDCTSADDLTEQPPEL